MIQGYPARVSVRSIWQVFLADGYRYLVQLDERGIGISYDYSGGSGSEESSFCRRHEIDFMTYEDLPLGLKNVINDKTPYWTKDRGYLPIPQKVLQTKLPISRWRNLNI
jgi:hypothetical protein